MTTAVQELKQIPFSHLIGAPLAAAIEAQALAAQSTIEFIEKAGHVEGSNAVRSLTFDYQKKGADDTDDNFRLTVPLLSVVPIPYIRLDEITIDFKAKLTDSITANKASTKDVTTSASGSTGFFSPVKLNFRVAAAMKNSTSSQSSATRDYSMDIHVRAVQSEMPGGLAKILDILENAISDRKPVTASDHN